jgi:hypothetical protein
LAASCLAAIDMALATPIVAQSRNAARGFLPSMIQKIAIVCLIGIAVVCALVLFDDYSKCQHEYHRGCAPVFNSLN